MAVLVDTRMVVKKRVRSPSNAAKGDWRPSRSARPHTLQGNRVLIAVLAVAIAAEMAKMIATSMNMFLGVFVCDNVVFEGTVSGKMKELVDDAIGRRCNIRR